MDSSASKTRNPGKPPFWVQASLVCIVALSCVKLYVALSSKHQPEVPCGFKTHVFANQNLLAHPVSIHIDNQNRVFVAETNNFATTGYNNFDEQLACKTRSDANRLDEALNDNSAWEPERLRVLIDRDGDGEADESTVFCEKFDRFDGCASGITVRDSEVWFGVSPNLWKFSDEDGDNIADKSSVIAHGFGVRQKLRGHDLNSITFGPDGKLYFCNGDRGAHIETDDDVVSAPHCGSVMRCNPDGTELELFATGLRNPQGLAFDNFGNLWTGDNDSNLGEKARWLHVVEGGNYGWQIGYQLVDGAGPWIQEDFCGQSDVPFRLPAAGFLVSTPSGLSFNPGTGLPAKYDGQFFLADYIDGINVISIEPSGASYRMKSRENFLKLMGLTDVKFGPDGSMFVADWILLEKLAKQGRILRITHPESAALPEAKETASILKLGLKEHSQKAVLELLGHPDQRVRNLAADAIVRSGDSETELVHLAQSSDNQLQRIHAIWALGRLSSRLNSSCDAIAKLLSDSDSEIRAQAAKLLGEIRCTSARPELEAALKDNSARVRAMAVTSLGKLGRTCEASDIELVFALVDENADRDLFLRHAAVLALARMADDQLIIEQIINRSPSVRLAGTLALRRLKSQHLANFLNDTDKRVALAATRAIHDTPIIECWPELAAQLDRTDLPTSMVSRVINVNYRLGTDSSAKRLSAFADCSSNPLGQRTAAIDALANWASPNPKDRVTGAWRPIPVRSSQPACEAIKPLVRSVQDNKALVAAIALASEKLSVEIPRSELVKLATSLAYSSTTRCSALRSLGHERDSKFEAALKDCLNAEESPVVLQAIELLQANDAGWVNYLVNHTDDPEKPLTTRQAAIDALGRIKGDEAKLAVERLSKKTDPELALELREACLAHALTPRRFPDSQLNFLLYGGDADRGRFAFHRNEKTQCSRCHSLNGDRTTLGPSLAGIGKKRSRDHILQSIIEPGVDIAPEYQKLTIATDEGQLLTGTLVEKTNQAYKIRTADGEITTIACENIEDVSKPSSAMPSGFGDHLTHRQIRDLLAFLTQDPPKFGLQPTTKSATADSIVSKP